MNAPLPFPLPEVKIDAESIRIYFCGSLHLYLKRARLLGIKSWRDGAKHFIEFTMEHGTTTVEYDKFEKWIEALKGLDACLSGAG